MIDTKELRIGNLIYWDIPSKKDIVHEIVGVTWRRINTIPISLGDNIEEYKPIKLTEELLLKLGFKEIENEFYYKSFRYTLLKTKSYRGFLFCDGTKTLNAVEYLHDLQNLFFALTKYELSMK